MSPPKSPPPKMTAEEFSKLWPRLPLSARQWIDKAVQTLLTSPLPARAMFEKLRQNAGLQTNMDAILQDSNLSVGDKTGFLLNLVQKKMDVDMAELSAKSKRGAATTELERQKLQQFMEKQRQMAELMSSIMVQQHETAKSIINNIRG